MTDEEVLDWLANDQHNLGSRLFIETVGQHTEFWIRSTAFGEDDSSNLSYGLRQLVTVGTYTRSLRK